MRRRHTQRHLTQVSVHLGNPFSTPLAQHFLSVLFYPLVAFIYAKELVYRLAILGVFGLCQDVAFGLDCAEVPRVAIQMTTHRAHVLKTSVSHLRPLLLGSQFRLSVLTFNVFVNLGLQNTWVTFNRFLALFRQAGSHVLRVDVQVQESRLKHPAGRSPS